MSIWARAFAGGTNTDRIVSSNFTATSIMSFSIWAYLTSYSTTPGRFWTWADDATNSPFNSRMQQYTNATPANVLEYLDGADTVSGIWSIPGPATGAWFHLLVVHDQTSIPTTPLMWINGTSQTVTQVQVPSGTVTTATEEILLGNRTTTHQNCVNGRLGPFAVWNTALGSTEATKLANGTPPCAISPDNLIAYFPLDRADNPEWELVTNTGIGVVTGTTLISGPSQVDYARCHSYTQRQWGSTTTARPRPFAPGLAR